MMISTRGQESSWIARVLVRTFQKFIAVSLRKSGRYCTDDRCSDDQNGYKKFIVNHANDANISHCTYLLAIFLCYFVKSQFSMDAPAKTRAHGHHAREKDREEDKGFQ
jgi:hypothetical protein